MASFTRHESGLVGCTVIDVRVQERRAKTPVGSLERLGIVGNKEQLSRVCLTMAVAEKKSASFSRADKSWLF